MAGAAYVFPQFLQAMATAATNRPSFVSGSVDTIKMGLAQGSFTRNATTEAYTTVAQFLANSGGTALTEPSGVAYARQTLTGVSFTTSGLLSTLTASSPVNFPTATGNYSAQYAFIYDYTAGGSSDTAGLMVAYWDFGGSLSVVTGGNITLSINAGGIANWTASA